MMSANDSGGSMAPLGLDAADELTEAQRRERARGRRARFTRYVTWGMGACVLLLVAGGARQFVLARTASAEGAPRASQAFLIAAPPSAPAAPVTASSPVEPTTAPAVASDTLPSNPKEAKREKRAAQRALERGRLAAAITSGTRSTSLDPTDAEAWLVLGAAYMEKGDTVSARHAFTACSKSATHGPKGECAAMMR
jgi:cytochrome c-type biogenesis protein CcmH/NrfG